MPLGHAACLPPSPCLCLHPRFPLAPRSCLPAPITIFTTTAHLLPSLHSHWHHTTVTPHLPPSHRHALTCRRCGHDAYHRILTTVLTSSSTASSHPCAFCEKSRHALSCPYKLASWPTTSHPLPSTSLIEYQKTRSLSTLFSPPHCRATPVSTSRSRLYACILAPTSYPSLCH